MSKLIMNATTVSSQQNLFLYTCRASMTNFIAICRSVCSWVAGCEVSRTIWTEESCRADISRSCVGASRYWGRLTDPYHTVVAWVTDIVGRRQTGCGTVPSSIAVATLCFICKTITIAVHSCGRKYKLAFHLNVRSL